MLHSHTELTLYFLSIRLLFHLSIPPEYTNLSSKRAHVERCGLPVRRQLVIGRWWGYQCVVAAVYTWKMAVGIQRTTGRWARGSARAPGCRIEDLADVSVYWGWLCVCWCSSAYMTMGYSQVKKRVWPNMFKRVKTFAWSVVRPNLKLYIIYNYDLID